MYRISGLGHVVTGGLHTGRSVYSGNVKLGDVMRFDKCRKFFARQSIAFRLYENILRYDVQLRDKLRAMGIRLKSSRPGRKIVVLV